MKSITNDSTPVPKGEFDRIINTQNILLVGVVVVLFVTFLSPIIDAWRFRAASYEALDQRVSDQNQKIKYLTDEIMDLNTALGVKKVIDRDLPSTIEVEKKISTQGE